MKFSYKRFSKDIIRPIIPIIVSYNNESLKYSVLIDSGADISIFDAQIATILGIPLTSGEKQKVFGITGISEPYYVHTVTIEVGGYAFRSKVGFLQNIAAIGYGVVGQHGFFDKFVVMFDLKKETIQLNPKNFN